ncbi:hypothetical protein [Mycolicibacterium sp. PDY-3]|uniref:hypothetical protein n=1 Tax=Mycolicibacterium sp. PDY-3 TaxID=3376069 RepID=UPI00379E5C7E
MDIDVRSLSNRDVLNLWSDAMVEMRRRDLVRTNNVVGELAEAIVHAHFGGVRGTFVEKGWDVRTDDGIRIQVKGMRRTVDTRKKAGTVYDGAYDALVIIVFGPKFELLAAYETTPSVVERMFKWSERLKGRAPTVTQRFVNDPEVSELDLSAAYELVLSTALPLP